MDVVVVSDVMREVLVDEDSERRRLAPTGARQLLLPERLGERRSRFSLRAEPAALRPRPVQGPEPICPASLELVDLARLHLVTASDPVGLRERNARTHAAAKQEHLPVGPEEANGAALLPEAIARNVAGLKPIEHPVHREPDALGDLARSHETVVVYG